MSLSNIPTFLLVQEAEDTDLFFETEDDFYDFVQYQDDELNLRVPDETTYYFGDVADKPVFLPIIQDWDEEQGEIEPWWADA